MLRGQVAQLASLHVKVEGTLATGLEKAARWLRRGLYLTQISARHVKMVAKTLANNLPAIYRDGAEMVGHVAAAATLDGRRANAVGGGGACYG